MHKLSRREREKQNRRNEILQAAWEVFASKDYDSATIDEIAEAAELSKGTVYLYFQNKADLFLSTVEMGMEKHASTIQAAISSSEDPVSGLKEIISNILNFYEENAGFFKILTSEQSHFEIHAEMRDSCNFKERFLAEMSRNVNMIADYIQSGIEMGVFRQINSRDAAFALLSVTRGFIFRWIIEPAEFRLSEKAEIITAILLDGLRERDSVQMDQK